MRVKRSHSPLPSSSSHVDCWKGYETFQEQQRATLSRFFGRRCQTALEISNGRRSNSSDPTTLTCDFACSSGFKLLFLWIFVLFVLLSFTFLFSFPVSFLLQVHALKDSTQHHVLASPADDDDDKEICQYPGDTGFEKVLTRQQLFDVLAEHGRYYVYNGKQSLHGEAAAEMHRHISCAVQQKPEFTSFCNSGENTDEFNIDQFEALAFLAHVKQETLDLSNFEEPSFNRYCHPVETYPCAQNNASYHGRGPLKLRGNEDYGKFSEFYYGKKEKLAIDPSLIKPQGVSGMVSALWKWMLPRRFGDDCPTSYVRVGRMSCHEAIHKFSEIDENIVSTKYKGFGLTIFILGGGPLCCPQPLSMLSAPSNSPPNSPTTIPTTSINNMVADYQNQRILQLLPSGEKTGMYQNPSVGAPSITSSYPAASATSAVSPASPVVTMTANGQLVLIEPNGQTRIISSSGEIPQTLLSTARSSNGSAGGGGGAIPFINLEAYSTSDSASFENSQHNRSEFVELRLLNASLSPISNVPLTSPLSTAVPAVSSQPLSPPSSSGNGLSAVDAGWRVGNLATGARRVGLKSKGQEMPLPGSVNCSNYEVDTDHFCESLTRGCPALAKTSVNGQNCRFTCVPMPTTLEDPVAYSSTKFDACGYSCSASINGTDRQFVDANNNAEAPVTLPFENKGDSEEKLPTNESTAAATDEQKETTEETTTAAP